MKNIILFNRKNINNFELEKYSKSIYSGELSKELSFFLKKESIDYISLMKFAKKYGEPRLVNLYPVLKILHKKGEKEVVFINEYVIVGKEGKIELYYLMSNKWYRITKNDVVYNASYSTLYNFGLEKYLNKIGYNIHYIYDDTFNSSVLNSKLGTFLFQGSQFNKNVLEGIDLCGGGQKSKVFSKFLLKKIIETNFVQKHGFTDIVVKVGGTSLGKGILFFNLNKKEDLENYKHFLLDNCKGSYIITKRVNQSDYELRCYVNTLNNKVKINGYLLKKKREDMETHHSGGAVNYKNFSNLEDIKKYVLEQTKGHINLSFTEEKILDFLSYLKNNNVLKHGAVDLAILKDGEFVFYENNILFMANVDENGVVNVDNFFEDLYTDMI